MQNNQIQMLFKYILEYKKLGTKIITNIEDYNKDYDTLAFVEDDFLELTDYITLDYKKSLITDEEIETVYTFSKPILENPPQIPKKIEELNSDDLTEEEHSILKEYKEKYNKWEKENKIKLKADDIYKQIFKIRNTLLTNDDIELVIGSYFIKDKNNSNINYPLLEKPAYVAFDEKNANLSIILSEEEARLNQSILNKLDITHNQLGEFAIRLKEEDINPLDEDTASDYCRSLLQQVSPDSEFLENITDKSSRRYTVTPHKAMLVKLKTDFATRTLEQVVEAINTEGEEIPKHILQLAGLMPVDTIQQTEKDIYDQLAEVNGESPDVLFAKPANKEQLSIAENIRQASAVVVQGPPGTGKTHTIANLIGDILQQGQTVLVTSHTKKALSVLKEKLPEDLQKLTVLLATDKIKQEIENSVSQIQDLVSRPESEYKNRTIKLEQTRYELLKEQRVLRVSLLSDRTKEKEKYIFGDLQYSTIDMAEEVAKYEKNLAILPAIQTNEPLGLTNDFLYDTYQMAYKFNTTQNRNFEDIKQKCEKYFSNGKLSDEDLKNIEQIRYILQSLDNLGSFVLRDIYINTGQNRKWEKLYDDINKAYQKSVELSGRLGFSIISVSIADDETLRKSIDELYKIFDGNIVSKIKRNFRLAQDNIKIDGNPIATKEQLDTAVIYLDLEKTKKTLGAIWDSNIKLAVDKSFSDMGVDIWPTLGRYSEQIKTAIEGYETLKTAIINLEKSIILLKEKNMFFLPTTENFEWVISKSEEAFTTLIKLDKIYKNTAGNQIDFENNILEIEKWSYDFAQIIKKHDTNNIQHIRTIDFKNLWRVKNFESYLNELEKDRVDNLNKKLEQIGKEIHKITNELIFNKSLYHLTKKINEQTELKIALNSWRNAQKKITKTGKTRHLFQKAAQQEMKKAQASVPVWIMPTNTVMETMHPAHNKFDVIIIDEASQCDLSALGILYMGKKIIIVGDDNQVSPDSKVLIDEVEALRNTYLTGHISEPMNFDYRNSLFDIGKVYFRELMLKEHFRCVPEIIAYSNKLSYNNEIKPLKPSDPTFIPILPVRVDGIENGRENQQEAEWIANKILELSENEIYENKTIGVINLAGGAGQIKRIYQEIYNKVNPSVIEDRKILVGSSAEFQGDERDIMFLSMVDSGTGDGTPIRKLTAEARFDQEKKKYNVAMSRAKIQVFIVHSIDYKTELAVDDVRRDLLDYAYNYKDYINSLADIESKSDSPFETEVAMRLKSEGFVFEQQYKIGAYRLDFCLKNKDGKRIALECDGEAFHSTQSQILSDLQREAVLSRLGFGIVRVRGSAWYRNKDKAFEKVMEELVNYGVPYVNITPNL